MFGKLIGFEFRSSIRMLAIVWAGLLASSILFGLSLRIASSSDSFSLFSGIITTVSTVLFMALFITMIQRKDILVVNTFMSNGMMIHLDFYLDMTENFKIFVRN